MLFSSEYYSLKINLHEQAECLLLPSIIPHCPQKFNPISEKSSLQNHRHHQQKSRVGDVIENLTPIYHRVNNGIMKHYEYMIRNAVYINEYVFVEVLPFYAGNNGVPLFIEITAFSFNGAFQLSVPIINVK